MFVFYLLSFFSLAAVLLNSIVLISSNTNNGVIKRLNWSHGRQKECGDNCADLYVGTWDILSKSDTASDSKVYWNTATCSDVSDFCDDCESSMKAVLAMVVVSAAFSIPSVFTNMARSTESGNNASNKLSGAFTSFIAMCAGIAAVVVFSKGCQKYIRRETEDDFKWFYGSAWIMMVVVCGLHALNLLVNLLANPTTIIKNTASPPSSAPPATATEVRA